MGRAAPAPWTFHCARRSRARRQIRGRFRTASTGGGSARSVSPSSTTGPTGSASSTSTTPGECVPPTRSARSTERHGPCPWRQGSSRPSKPTPTDRSSAARRADRRQVVIPTAPRELRAAAARANPRRDRRGPATTRAADRVSISTARSSYTSCSSATTRLPTASWQPSSLPNSRPLKLRVDLQGHSGGSRKPRSVSAASTLRRSEQQRTHRQSRGLTKVSGDHSRPPESGDPGREASDLRASFPDTSHG